MKPSHHSDASSNVAEETVCHGITFPSKGGVCTQINRTLFCGRLSIAFNLKCTVRCKNETDGSIWKGDLFTGIGEVVVTGDGITAVGLDYDPRSGYLFVAGGASGTTP